MMKNLNLQKNTSLKIVLIAILALFFIGVIYTAGRVSQNTQNRSQAAVLSIAPTPTVAAGTILIDPASDNHPISPYIYGWSDADPGGTYTTYRDMGISLLRWGGNSRSRYNWEINASNTGSDNGYCNTSKNSAFTFVSSNQSYSMQTLLTIPLIGWVSRNTSTCSSGYPGTGGTALIQYPTPGWETGSISGYNPTTNRNNTSYPSYPRKGTSFSLTPTPGDGAVYEDEWVNALKARFGQGSGNGVRFYDLDNESDLWADETHVDIHPARLGYDEELYYITQYADAIKAVDPTAELLAPVSWEYSGVWYSERDWQPGGPNSNPIDYNSHGNLYRLQWLLRNIRQHDLQVGHRSIDAVDIHFYPQNGLVPGSSSPDATEQATRLATPRGLWDPTYHYPGFLGSSLPDGGIIRFFPRIKEIINAEYPGTKIAITEWNWGSESHISGGLAAADVLGIFGREDLYVGTWWPFNNPGGTPIALAWKLFRNYDGNLSKFGDTSIKAQTAVADVDKISAYASKDSSTGQMKVVLINKQPSTTANFTLNFNNYSYSGPLSGYRFGSGSSSIQSVSGLSISGSSMSVSLPAYTATLIVFPTQSGTPIPTATPTLPAPPSPTPTIIPIPTFTAVCSQAASITAPTNQITSSDVASVSNMLGLSCSGCSQDLNHDGRITIQDVNLVRNCLNIYNPLPSNTPGPTRTPTPAPTGTQITINFDSGVYPTRTPESPLTGQYPANIIDWGSSNTAWYYSGPWAPYDSTNSLTFVGDTSPKSATFTFIGGQRKLVSFKAVTSGTNANPNITITATCGSQSLNYAITPANFGQLITVPTGWANTCSSVTLSSSNGGATNFDDLIVQ